MAQVRLFVTVSTFEVSFSSSSYQSTHLGFFQSVCFKNITISQVKLSLLRIYKKNPNWNLNSHLLKFDIAGRSQVFSGFRNLNETFLNKLTTVNSMWPFTVSKVPNVPRSSSSWETDPTSRMSSSFIVIWRKQEGCTSTSCYIAHTAS